MISKIIQKEKEQQDKYLEGCGISKLNPNKRQDYVILCGRDNERCFECLAKRDSHKQSLINLREHMGELATRIEDIWENDSLGYLLEEIKGNIKELTKMIEKYK